MKKLKIKWIMHILLLLLGSKLNAQNVGVGTTTPTHKLHIAGNARVTIKPQALVTDSVVMRFSDGELRQMSIARLIGQLDTDGDGIVDFDDPDIDGDGILNASDTCKLQYGCTPSGCPRSCNTAPSVGTIASLNCAGATNNGTLTSGTAASGVSSIIAYTGGNGGAYSAQTVSSTGVTGLTATLSGGSFAVGAGSVTYTITGTPASSGTASFAISLGGQSCTLTRTVSAGAGTITALNCAGARNIGSLTNGTAASGVSSRLPYTGGNGGTYAAFSVASTGVTGLTASIAAGTLVTGADSFTVTITGTPTSVGTASFVINICGQSCTLTRTVGSSAFTFPYAGAGFDNATGCIVNGSNATVNALFPSIYVAYGGGGNIDVLGSCGTYGTAWSPGKFIGFTKGDAISIDLGTAPAPGSTFTMTMYERAHSCCSSPKSYQVGLSTASGTSGGAGLNNLFTSPGTTTTGSWVSRTITFTVPASPSNLRYLTIESVDATSAWIHLDF